MSKSGANLVIHTGGSESVSLKDWYLGSSNQTLHNIQMILDATADFDVNSADPMRNQRVQGFDFRGLVNQFDQARTANPGITSWQLSDALAQFHLSGSNNAALGGDLAYYYGVNNGLTGISLSANNPFSLGDCESLLRRKPHTTSDSETWCRFGFVQHVSYRRARSASTPVTAYVLTRPH